MSDQHDYFEARFPLKPVFEHAVRADDLAQLSQSIGSPLPEDYIRFLREWNGVIFTEFSPQFQYDDFQQNWVSVLYGLSGPTLPDDVRNEAKSYDFVYRVPPTILGIGKDVCWNRICLSLASDTFGQVFFWEPGEAWEYIDRGGRRLLLKGNENIVTSKYLVPIAKSFAEFWQMLEADFGDE
ncbi:MAG: SMI1/KNR4 family protein [Planctomycetes bacterium]|nr:SMI1/KNR4 family protein [Planctomycetota bacterium]